MPVLRFTAIISRSEAAVYQQEKISIWLEIRHSIVVLGYQYHGTAALMSDDIDLWHHLASDRSRTDIPHKFLLQNPDQDRSVHGVGHLR